MAETFPTEFPADAESGRSLTQAEIAGLEGGHERLKAMVMASPKAKAAYDKAMAQFFAKYPRFSGQETEAESE